MKKLTLVLLAAIALSAFAAETKVQGYLVDLACAGEEGQKDGFGAKHSKDCLQMAECVKSGYGVLTDDKKVIKFDAASNEKAKQFIADMKKTKDIKVNVVGTVNGDNMAVSKIELQ
jgi:ABC-type glycerol-3-phosphate transport system substrate-binding protein